MNTASFIALLLTFLAAPLRKAAGAFEQGFETAMATRDFKATFQVVSQALGGGLVGTMIGALVTILIFVVLAPVVADQVAGANTSNFGGGAAALFGLTTLFFVILGIVGIIKLIR